MKQFCQLLVTLTIFASSSAFAAGGTDVGVFFGMKNASFDTDTAGTDFKTKTGLMGGVIATGEMGGLMFRTGGYYASRAAEITAGPLAAELSVATVDVPVTLLYKFNDMLGVFGGALFALKISDDCTGDATICSNVSDELESFHTAATFGLQAKFHPNWSGEVFYEHGLNDIAEDVSMSAISLGVLFIY